MRKNLRIGLFAGALVLAVMPTPRISADPGPGKGDDGRGHSDQDIRHVLLISIDGMHAVDFENCVASNTRSEEHTSELQSQFHLVCRLLLEKKKKKIIKTIIQE